jgi:hypothetical protein
VPAAAYDLAGLVVVAVVPSPKSQLLMFAPVLLLVVVKLFPSRHWALLFSEKEAVGLALTVTLLVWVSRQPLVLAAISRME